MTFNFYLGAFVSSSLLTITIILTELSADAKLFFANTLGHDWTAKALIVVISFFLFSFLLKNKNKLFGFKDERLALHGLLLNLLIILVFHAIRFAF